MSHLSNVLMTIIRTGIKISKAAVGLDKDLIFIAIYVQPWCVCLCVVEVIDLAWWTFPVRCRCGPSSLSGPHSDTGLPFPLVNVAALLSLVVLLFAAGFHSSTSALASPSVLLVAAVAGGGGGDWGGGVTGLDCTMDVVCHTVLLCRVKPVIVLSWGWDIACCSLEVSIAVSTVSGVVGDRGMAVTLISVLPGSSVSSSAIVR